MVLTCGPAVAQTSIRATPDACGQLTQLQVPGIALTVVKAWWIEAGAPIAGGRAGAPPVATELPAYCRLDGVIDRRVGAAGTAYGIGFALAMPENWNGRFLFQGGGGLNGSVQPPLGGSAAGGTPGLARGFAVVSTDTGHQGRGGFDASFTQDQQANLDFAYAAVGRVAEVSKRILSQHYGRPPARSYFAGCSTGGREAMLMAQRYPLSFDSVQATTLAKAFGGPKDSRGRQVYPGFPFDTGIAVTQGLPGLLHGGQLPAELAWPPSGWTWTRRSPRRWPILPRVSLPLRDGPI